MFSKLKMMDQTSLRSARQRTKIATLILYINELNKLETKVEQVEKELRSIKETYNEFKFKRNRLMDQNFSSAKHLKKTHRKYWTEMQNHAELIESKSSELTEHRESIKNLKDKIQSMGKDLLRLITN